MEATSRSGGASPGESGGASRPGGAAAYPAGGGTTGTGMGTGGAGAGAGASKPYCTASAAKAGVAGATTGSPYAGGASGEREAASSSNGHDRVGHASDGASPAEALKEAAARIGEIREYAAYLVAAKLDAWKTSLRNLGIYAALGLVGAIVGGALMATAAVLLLVGIAHGLGDLLWDKWWLGDLIVGLLVLGGAAAGIIFGLKKLTGTFKKQLVAKYEDRQRKQRINFGHDVEERAVGREAEAGADRGSR
jgi:putative superfamily III holin-X